MIDIIIPTFGASTRLHQTLTAIIESESLDEINKIIVVENGDKYQAETVCNSFKTSKILYSHTHQKGLVHARNTGTDISKSTHLLFIDDDIELNPKTLETYNKAILNHGLNCYFSGPLIPKYELSPPSWLKDYLPWSAKDYTLGNNEIEIDYPGFLGGNLCIPKQMLLAAGMYEGMGATGHNAGGVGEESRLQSRLLKQGHKAIWLPNASGYHWVPKNKCNISFAVQRAYRHGLTDADGDKSQYPLLLGAPRWLFKKITIDVASFLSALLTPFNIKRITEKRIALAKTRGMIAGYRHAKNRALSGK